MVQKLELFPTSYEYSIGKYNNLKELFVRGDVDISGNIAMSGNINCNEINSTSITATTFYGDGSQLTGIITSGGSANLNEYSDASFGNVDVSGNIQYEYDYETRFLDENTNILSGEEEYLSKLNNGDNVYIACFVGCTYHCS